MKYPLNPLAIDSANITAPAIASTGPRANWPTVPDSSAGAARPAWRLESGGRALLYERARALTAPPVVDEHPRAGSPTWASLSDVPLPGTRQTRAAGVLQCTRGSWRPVESIQPVERLDR
ncbi:MAG: hypothetical protein ACRDYX_00680 [Egibacteraceae bacterium]